jgi:predicted component of type VI protein secretion system
MLGRWLPWIAIAAVLGVFLPPLVSEPSPPPMRAPSGKMSSAALSATHVSELIEPPPMTELAGEKSRFFEPPAAGSFEPPSAGNVEAKSQPQPQIAVNLPGPPASRHRSRRQSASRHVAFHQRIYRRICCTPPVIDKTNG